MPLKPAYEGEDVPITYGDGATDPDDQGTDGVPDADITITAPDGTEVVSAAAMSYISTGHFEYVWDTTGVGTGTFTVECTAEYNAETDIERNTITIR